MPLKFLEDGASSNYGPTRIDPTHCPQAWQEQWIRMGAHSQEEGKLFSFEPLHNFANVLRAVTGAEQQGLVGFDDDEIANPDSGNKFLGAPKEVAVSVERNESSGRNVFSGLARQQFVDGGPGANVAPAYFSGQNKNAW